MPSAALACDTPVARVDFISSMICAHVSLSSPGRSPPGVLSAPIMSACIFTICSQVATLIGGFGMLASLLQSGAGDACMPWPWDADTIVASEAATTTAYARAFMA